MKIPSTMLIAVWICAIAGCKSKKQTSKAEQAVIDFHLLYDAEDFEAIYNTAHVKFQKSQPKPVLLDFLRSVRSKLGKVRSTRLDGTSEAASESNTTIQMTYITEYEHGVGEEIFTFKVKNQKAELLGWNINSKDLFARSLDPSLKDDPLASKNRLNPKLPIGTNKDQRVIQARGVRYIVPWEDGSHFETPAGFQYKGEIGKISETDRILTVDGANHGAVKTGDTVTLLEKGKLLINGEPRAPVRPRQNKSE